MPGKIVVSVKSQRELGEENWNRSLEKSTRQYCTVINLWLPQKGFPTVTICEHKKSQSFDKHFLFSATQAILPRPPNWFPPPPTLGILMTFLESYLRISFPYSLWLLTATIWPTRKPLWPRIRYEYTLIYPLPSAWYSSHLLSVHVHLDFRDLRVHAFSTSLHIVARKRSTNPSPISYLFVHQQLNFPSPSPRFLKSPCFFRRHQHFSCINVLQKLEHIDMLSHSQIAAVRISLLPLDLFVCSILTNEVPLHPLIFVTNFTILNSTYGLSQRSQLTVSFNFFSDLFTHIMYRRNTVGTNTSQHIVNFFIVLWVSQEFLVWQLQSIVSDEADKSDSHQRRQVSLWKQLIIYLSCLKKVSDTYW